jgi:hypothetical protein
MGQVPIAINFSLVYTQRPITQINAVLYLLYNTAEVTVDTKLGYEMEDGNYDSIITTMARHFSFLPPVQIGSGGPPSFLFNGKLGLKQPGRQAALLTASVEFRNDWRYVSTSPI